MPPVYDTYACVQRAMEAGMPERQAAALMRDQVQLIADTLATKEDINGLDRRISSAFLSVRSEITLLRAETQAMEARITARLGGLMIALAAALAAVIKLF